MFRGITSVTLDAKGRLALPIRFRESVRAAADGRLVITIDMSESCLLLYPLPEWEVVQARLESLSNVQSRNRTLQRLLIGHATDVEMDTNGRLVVPPMLRQFAALHKKLVVVGQGNKLELWAESTWQERRDAWLADDAMKSFDDPESAVGLSV